MSTTYFIEPLDVLVLRGNKLFGDPGSFGESLVPPWPSVAAGALRSALLAHKGLDPARFARGEIDDPELGTPARPGSFTVTAFHLARRSAAGQVEALHPLPADLGASRSDCGPLAVRPLLPAAPHAALASSAPLPFLPILAETDRGKPESGLWLTAAGWAAYLAGEPVRPDHLLKSGDLWQLQPRVGVGLDPAQRRAADGKLFTVQAAALAKREHGHGHDAGFLAQIAGADGPESLALSFGGDGRGAVGRRLEPGPPATPGNYAAIATAGRCRLVLTAPGLFPRGWLPTGAEGIGADLRFDLHGVRGRLAAAAVPRSEVVSGFDLAAWSQGKGGPKPAQRAAPAGSVYWLDQLEATPEALGKLVEQGLWPEPEDNQGRRAEGFNQVAVAAWSGS